jgi:vacuolar-type H+-ATPase catalytic subunit A/Vma1
MKNYKSDISIQPSRRLGKGLSAWEVRDNKGKLVGAFDANKDKTADKHDKLIAIAEIKNIQNLLSDVRERIKDVFLKNEEWEICDRAMQAISQTKMVNIELAEIIKHIKQS